MHMLLHLSVPRHHDRDYMNTGTHCLGHSVHSIHVSTRASWAPITFLSKPLVHITSFRWAEQDCYGPYLSIYLKRYITNYSGILKRRVLCALTRRRHQTGSQTRRKLAVGSIKLIHIAVAGNKAIML
jgi:hypothetical protein